MDGWENLHYELGIDRVKGTVTRHCTNESHAWSMYLSAKIIAGTRRKISPLGSQPVSLMSQGQIAVVGEDLQYLWQIIILQHGGQKSNLTLTLAQSPMP